MSSLINKQLLLTAYAYLFIMEQQKVQQGSEGLRVKSFFEKVGKLFGCCNDTSTVQNTLKTKNNAAEVKAEVELEDRYQAQAYMGEGEANVEKTLVPISLEAADFSAFFEAETRFEISYFEGTVVYLEEEDAESRALVKRHIQAFYSVWSEAGRETKRYKHEPTGLLMEFDGKNVTFAAPPGAAANTTTNKHHGNDNLWTQDYTALQGVGDEAWKNEYVAGCSSVQIEYALYDPERLQKRVWYRTPLGVEVCLYSELEEGTTSARSDAVDEGVYDFSGNHSGTGNFGNHSGSGKSGRGNEHFYYGKKNFRPKQK